MPRVATSKSQAAFALVVAAWLVALPLIYFWPGWDVRPDPTGAPPSHLTLPPLRLFADLASGLAIVLAMGLAGAALARWLMPDERGLLRVLLAFALGAGALIGVALVLAALGLMRSAPLLGAAFVLAAVGVVTVRPWQHRHRLRPLAAGIRPTADPVVTLSFALLAVAAAFALVGALAPEVEYDALWFHVGFPQAWLHSGGLTDFPCQYVSGYPFGTELLFGYGLALDGVVGAKLVHFTFWILLAATTYDLGRRLFDPRAAIVGTVVCATAPTILWEGTTAYVDLATAFFIVLALDLAVVHVRAPARRTAIACGALLGLALSTKLLGLLALPVIAAMIAFGPRRRPMAGRLVDGTIVAAVALAIVLPWLVRAQILTGNPVFPSLTGIFGWDPGRWSARSDAGLTNFLERFGKGDGIGALLALPWNLTMHAAAFGGAFGVLPLLLVPLAVRLRPRREALLVALVAIGFVVLWFSPISSQQARLLIPAVAMLAPFAGAGFNRVFTAARARSRLAAVAVAALCGGVAVLTMPPFIERHERDRAGNLGYLTHVIRETPVPYVLGDEPKDAYLARRVRTYAADRALLGRARPGTRVLAFADPTTALTGIEHVPYYSDCLDGILAVRGDGPAIRSRLDALHIGYVLWSVNQRRLPQTLPIADPMFERRYLRLVHRDGYALLFAVRRPMDRKQ